MSADPYVLRLEADNRRLRRRRAHAVEVVAELRDEVERCSVALRLAYARASAPEPSEVLAVERIHEWVYADEDRHVLIEKDGMDIAVHFCGPGGGNAVDAVLANAVLGVELIEEADDAR